MEVEKPLSAEIVETESLKNPVEESIDLQVNVSCDEKNTTIESGDDTAPDSYSEEHLKEQSGDSENENETDGDESEGSLILERQEGDGQESIPQKANKVDDDEDKKNPQYIPKRGTFYEHDDRTADDIKAQEDEEKDKADKDGGKKKLWQDKKERWSHDRFNDQEQAPKSKTELIQIYGYDIRNEDGPPRARRRRRYGRGPNKYTRDWKDEDAYNKSVSQKPPKRVQKPPSQSSEEFPPLTDLKEEKTNESISEQSEHNIERNISPQQSPNSNQPEERREFFQKEKTPSSVDNANLNNKYSEPTSAAENKISKAGSGRVQKAKHTNSTRYESLDSSRIDVSDYKGFTTKVRMGRNFRNQNTNNKHQKKDNHVQYQNNKKSDNKEQKEEGLESAMAAMSMQDSRVPEKGNQSKAQNRQGSVPPRMQGEPKGSKRYSSIRQRSLPEANNPPVMQHTNYFANDLTQSQQSQGTVIHQNPNLLQTPASITQLGAPPAIPLAQQVPAPNASILQGPPQYAPPYAQPAAFLQAAVPPPTFLQQQAPPILNYVQTPPQFPAGYQSFPYQQSQSTELYQPQGGITYYSTDQQIAQRTVPPKRPKAAIPIVAPPSSELKRGEEERKPEYTPEGEYIE
ncbi:protein CASC3 [Coccinella septempunctata]|uniref:protein CASC3 n=1 Tax=Coccinella septempunctata TaxID=41139 RepID=UPI001D066EA7|nr:protein CASC3 [Coccinella septempunctata]